MKSQPCSLTSCRAGAIAAALAALSLWGCGSAPPPAAATMQGVPAPSAAQDAPAMQGMPPAGAAVSPPVAVPVPPPPQAAAPAPAAAPERVPARDAKRDFTAEMAGRGLDPSEVARLLDQARYSETVARLVLPPSSPTVRSWPRYRSRFIESRRIKEGLAFQEEHAQTLARAEDRYGVPASIIVSVIGVETFYGRVTGNFRVIDALSTLAFNYPPQARSDRSAFFREQLAQFLVWCKETGSDPLAVKGSYAGAMGLPQFMPGSLRKFAVDGDGDGRIDLAGSPADAILSVAHFLVEHGWQRGQPVFLPINLPADPAGLVDGGLKPTLSWAQLQAAGARAQKVAGMSEEWRDWPLAVIDLYDGATGTTEYRVAAPNFFALTEYNRSYFYAASVTDLAVELERRNRVASRIRVGQLNTPVDR
ncbi:lytic murein transglycosylase B [Pigmentiphaga sp. NML080357]|uniref:lytic murein transglycosylase B n=1 Tax=Pigmentiphaga sp. NML080357 TaxID=2008675 RepID=UPI001E3A9DBB|nr:lytic murein transglycosylase B [Pigmentiphaga sp. NML080357]